PTRHRLSYRKALALDALNTRHELIAPVIMLNKEQREVSGEAFAQPDIVPIRLGDGVAKPLVGDLVRDEADDRSATERVLTVENRAGVFGAAVDPRRLHVAEFFVGVRTDVFTEKLHCQPRSLFKTSNARVTILMIDPGLKRDTFNRSGMMYGKLRDADGVQPRSDGRGLFPMRKPPPVAQVCLFLQESVRDDLIAR